MRNEHSGANERCPTRQSTVDRANGCETTEDDGTQNTQPREDAAARTRGCSGSGPRPTGGTDSSDEKPTVLPDGGVGLAELSDHEIVTEDQPAANDLTKFQTRILEILAVKPLYGLAIKRRLQTYYQEEVNHGRLYPNLDELIENGLVEKSELDKRTNEYALTDLGRRVVEFEANWAQQRLEGEDVETAGDVR